MRYYRRNMDPELRRAEQAWKTKKSSYLFGSPNIEQAQKDPVFKKYLHQARRAGQGVTCLLCSGKGYHYRYGMGMYDSIKEKCPKCSGSGIQHRRRNPELTPGQLERQLRALREELEDAQYFGSSSDKIEALQEQIAALEAQESKVSTQFEATTRRQMRDTKRSFQEDAWRRKYSRKRPGSLSRRRNPRKKPTRKCGKCNRAGHNVRTCKSKKTAIRKKMVKKRKKKTVTRRKANRKTTKKASKKAKY